MTRLLFCLVVLLLQACGTSQHVLEPHRATCEPLPQQVAQDGSVLPAGYKCLVTPGDGAYEGNACALIQGFYNREGAYIPSHTRCLHSDALVTYKSASPRYTPFTYGVGSAPCVTGYCGPVNVRGYYRKDGTYVRPHTRSRPRR